VSTDVSYRQAFRDHRILLPAQARGLRYRADSQLDGYPVWAVFRAPCGAAPGFAARNRLTQVRNFADLPSGAVYAFAQQMGWRPSSAGVRWYQRPAGPSANLELLVSATAGNCAFYLVAADGSV
jgi:hypothetical protein